MAAHIRPVTVIDLLSMMRAPQVHLRLDLVEQLLNPQHGGLGLRAWLRPEGPDYTLLYRERGALRASVQARAGPGKAPWEITGLAAWNADPDGAAGPWSELLVALGVQAGGQGTARLLARLPDEAWVELFRQAGFVPFAEELLLAWDGSGPTSGRQAGELRPAQPADQWAILRLHVGLTPPLVLQAEGEWAPVAGADAETWVWTEQESVRAYLQRRRSRHGTRLSLLLDPSWRQQAAAVLSHGLMGATWPVYLVLRSYQGELLDVAHRLGFRPYAEQVLLVKHLAVPQRVPHAAPARSAERPLEAAPSTPSVARANGTACKRADI